MITYQGEAKAVLYRDGVLYQALRGGGTTISYAMKEGDSWRLHNQPMRFP